MDIKYSKTEVLRIYWSKIQGSIYKEKNRFKDKKTEKLFTGLCQIDKNI